MFKFSFVFPSGYSILSASTHEQFSNQNNYAKIDEVISLQSILAFTVVAKEEQERFIKFGCGYRTTHNFVKEKTVSNIQQMLIPPSSPSTTTMDGRDVPDDKKSLLQLLQQVQQQMHQQQQEQDLHNLQALLSASTSSSSVAGGGHRAPAPAAPVPSAATSSSGITSSTLQSLQQLQGLASLLNGGAGTSSADLNSLSNPNPTNPVAQQQITPQALPMFGEGGRRSTGLDAVLGLNTTSSNSGSNNDNTTTTNLLSRGGFNQHQLSSSLGSDSSASATGSSFLAAALSAAGLTAPSTTLSAATGADVYAMAGPSGFQPPAQPLRNQPNSSTAEAVLHQHQLNLQRQLSRFGGNSSNDNGTIVPCRARGISKDHNKKVRRLFGL